MNSKERVKRTFRHEETDRVPIDYMANPNIDRRLKEYYGLDINDNDGLNDRLGVDFRRINVELEIPYTGPTLFRQQNDGIMVSPLWGFKARKVEHEYGCYVDYCEFPLKDAILEDIKAWPMPDADDFDYSVVGELCEKYKDYGIYVGHAGVGDNMNSAGMLFGMERVYMGLALDDEALLLYMDRRNEFFLESTRKTLEAANGAIDFLWIGEDLGTQIGPLISLDLFRKHIRPRLQIFVDLAKEYDIPVMIHSCGSSSYCYNDFLEMGITAIDTLQPEAKNMSPEYLIKTFGNKLCYHGCISTAGPIASGTVEEVEEYCKNTLDIMMPTNGYFFSPTHMIQDNSPTENIVKMYEVANTYGKYNKQ